MFLIAAWLLLELLVALGCLAILLATNDREDE